MDEYAFMVHYQDWWDIGCEVCGVSEGTCNCKWDWDMKFEDDKDHRPKWWGWLIAPKNLMCPYCSRGMSTYDGCCKLGDAYLKYRYAVAFLPESIGEIRSRIND